MLDDTIAAIATPLGEGGLAVIRLSGPRALEVAEKCFAPISKHSLKPSAAPTHTIHYGRIERAGRTVDEVLLSVMRQPRTFTREDIVEITCHGGILAAKIVLDTVLENGARLAEPGEFTKRAFLNGRIDLTQAEAVSDLIHARTELSLAAANEQLAGKLSQKINQLRDDMMKALAFVDTAGLRQAGDVIEQEGIRRSHETVTKAELILHVFDVSEPFTREDETYLAQFAHKKRIIVRNKMDLPMKMTLPLTLSLSPSDGAR